MTSILYSPEWRDLALAFCEARDAAAYSPPVGAGSISGTAIPPPSGMVPESCPASPADSGTPSVGAADVAGVAPTQSSGVSK
jgi:hypothetical protein